MHAFIVIRSGIAAVMQAYVFTYSVSIIYKKQHKVVAKHYLLVLTGPGRGCLGHAMRYATCRETVSKIAINLYLELLLHLFRIYCDISCENLSSRQTDR